MTRVALKSLSERRIRTVLTALAIVLGVAMISGAYTLTDTMGNAANSLSKSSYHGTDAVVSVKPPVARTSDDNTGDSAPLPASVLGRVRKVPGVGTALGNISDQAKIIGKDGKVAGSGPYFGQGVDGSSKAISKLTPFKLRDGRFASSPAQVVIDAGTADKNKLSVGDRVRVQANGPVRSFRISGIATFGDVNSLGTATFAVFDLHAAQSLFDKRGQFTEVLVAGDGSLPPCACASGSPTCCPRLPRAERVGQRPLHARRPEAVREHHPDRAGGVRRRGRLRGRLHDHEHAVDHGRPALARARHAAAHDRRLAPPGAALRGGRGVRHGRVRLPGRPGGRPGARGPAAERARLGGPRPAADGHGVRHAHGAGVAGRGRGRDGARGPRPGAARHPRVAGHRAARGVRDPTVPDRPPRHADRGGRDGAVAGDARHRPVRRRRRAQAQTGAARVRGAAPVRRRRARPPRLVRPLASVLGAPARRFGGSAGSLARQNSMRNPGRTAATAAALMIGIALVAFVAVIGQGMKSATRGSLENSVRGNYVLVGQDNWSPIDPAVTRAAAKVPGVRLATGLAQDVGKAFKGRALVDGVDPQRINQVYGSPWKQGSDASFAALSSGAVVTDKFAAEHHLKLGSPLTVHSSKGTPLHLRIVGVSKPDRFNALDLGQVTIARQTFDTAFAAKRERFAFVQADGGAVAGLKRALAPYPDAKAVTGKQFAVDQSSWVDQILAIFYVLLALCVLVSLFGIVNTLALGAGADQGAGDAQGDRHDPAPGAPDGPPRERDHRADRLGARHPRGHVPGGALDHGAERPGDALRSARGRSGGLHGRGDRGRHAGGDPARAPGGAPERARGPAVRVGNWRRRAPRRPGPRTGGTPPAPGSGRRCSRPPRPASAARSPRRSRAARRARTARAPIHGSPGARPPAPGCRSSCTITAARGVPHARLSKIDHRPA